MSDLALRYLPGAASVDAYVPNGLNQYSSVGGATLAYDGNGNLTTDAAGRTYIYSAENQLYTVRDAASVLLAQNIYYADGTRRYLGSASGGVRRFYYDGDQEIAEYDSADAALVRRYVRLPGSVDEPFLMIDYTLSASSK